MPDTMKYRRMKTGSSLLLCLILLTSHFVFAQQKEVKATANAENIFRKEQQGNLALVQYYRWFQAFETEQNEARINNHLAILSDSVLITTYNGPLKGKEGMLGFLDYVKSWKNSHHIKETVVTVNNDGSITLEADIVYQNILPDGKQNEYNLHYTTRLTEYKDGFPVFSEIKLLPVKTMENPVFEDAYTENRSKSIMYYWLYLADTYFENGAALEELVAPDFRLKLSEEEEIAGYEQFNVLMGNIRGQSKETLHTLKNLKSTLNADQTISVSADVEWKGINHKGEKRTGEVHHDWVLENNPDDRFAKIKEMKFTVTRPFQVVKNF